MTLGNNRHNDPTYADDQFVDVGERDDENLDKLVATDTNLVLGCAAAIALLAMATLIAYLWTL